MRILVVNGPILNLLGTMTLNDLETQINGWGREMGATVDTEQSNSESRIIALINGFDGDGIVLNPGAFTHSSAAIADAIAAVPTPVVEVHVSKVEQSRSLLAEACARTIYGRGPGGYRHALRHLINRAAMSFETIRYGRHDDNVGDLRLGGGDLVVVVHGGLWRQEYERDTTESLAVDLAKKGFTSWNIEYRRLETGGGWPASGEDVLTAVDSVPGLGIDAQRVHVVGHSAGSHLAMWAASRSTVAVSFHIAMAPLLDLAAAAANDDVGADECRRLLEQGAPPSMEPGSVATLIVHGDADQVVPVRRSVDFAARHGLELYRTGCDHFSLLDPTKPEWDWVIDRLEPA